jgi:DNA invertase Pin-like site-specific DNA recombinase
LTDMQGTASTDELKRRAGLYERVSRRNGRDAEALERTTLAEQRAYARAFVPGDTELVLDPERWQDIDISGAAKNADRPGLMRLLADVESGYIDDVIVGYLSRLGRSMIDVLANVKALNALGATVYLARERLAIIPNDPSGTSTVILAVFAAVAEMDRERLRESLRRNNKAARERGVSIQVPYGYRRSAGRGSVLAFDLGDAFGVLADDDAHISTTPADVVRDIYARRLQGIGFSAIAHELNAAGLPTPTMLEHLRGERKKPGAQHWKPNTVENMVATHTYKGVIPVGVAFEGEGRSRRATAYELLPGGHDELVSDDDWTTAQSSGRATRNGSTGDALLTGLVRCSSCSRTMRPGITSARNRHGNARTPGLRYHCPNGDCPKQVHIMRPGVDAYVVEQLLEDAIVREQELEVERAALESARADVDVAVAEYDVFVGRSGALPADVFARGNAQHSQRLEQAQRRLSVLEARATPNLAQTLHDFADLELETQRNVLDALLDAVVILPAPGRGDAGVISERVVPIPKGTAPFELSGTGKTIAARAWPL